MRWKRSATRARRSSSSSSMGIHGVTRRASFAALHVRVSAPVSRRPGHLQHPRRRSRLHPRHGGDRSEAPAPRAPTIWSACASTGCTPDYVRQMAAIGPAFASLTADDLVIFRIHGAKPELVQSYASFNGGALNTDDVVSMAIHGVDRRVHRAAGGAWLSRSQRGRPRLVAHPRRDAGLCALAAALRE